MKGYGWAAAAALALSACVDSTSILCDDGRVCPSGKVCDDVHALCVLPEQLQTCKALADGTDCSIDGKPAGICAGGVCVTARCGDGFTRAPEECDAPLTETQADCRTYGFHDAGVVTCRSDCTLDKDACGAICGDGTLNGNEACDGSVTAGTDCTTFGFYDAAGLACSSACTFDISNCHRTCGDGTIDPEEACDTSVAAGVDCTYFGYYYAGTPGTLTCTPRCTIDTTACTGTCGDRIPDSVEPCDGKAPAGLACASYGYDRGALGCTSGCAPDFNECQSDAWNAQAPGASQLLMGVWAASPIDVFVVGWSGAISRYNGTSWSAMTSGTTQPLRGVWGTSSSNVWAVGHAGTILHFDGFAWSSVTSPTTLDLLGVYGVSASLAWAVGNDGTMLVFNGSSWSTMASGISGVPLAAVWGTGASNIFVAALGAIRHWDGGTWSSTPSPNGLQMYGLWGSSANDVWAVGTSGAVGHYTGSWSFAPSISTLDIFFAVWGTSDTDIYVSTNQGYIEHYDGSAWTETPLGAGPLHALTGTGNADIFAAGSGVMSHFRGGGWTPGTVGVATPVMALWASSPSNVFAPLFDSKIQHFDGTSWTTATTASNRVRSITGSGSTLLAVGDTGEVMRFNGSWIEATPPTTENFYGAWMTSPTQAFIVGGNDLIYQDNGTTLTKMTVPANFHSYTAVWASSATNAFAVADGGTILHYNGTNWTSMTSNTFWDLLAVWGSGPSDVFVAGFHGTILHYDGVAWRAMQSGTTARLIALTGNGPSDVYATGAGGVLLHYDGLTWTADASRTAKDLQAAFSARTAVFAGGVGGLTLRRNSACRASETLCSDDADDDCDGFFDCDDSDCSASASCTAGGLCAGAAPLSCNASTGGTTQLGPRRLDRYSGSDWLEMGPEAYYLVSRATAGTITVTLNAGARDLDLAVLNQAPSGACSFRSAGTVAVSSTAGGTEMITFTAAANTPYYLVVDSFGTSFGAFSLTTSCP